MSSWRWMTRGERGASLVVMVVCQILAQDAITSLGGTVATPEVQVDFSVGQVASLSWTLEALIVNEGVIQIDDLVSSSIRGPSELIRATPSIRRGVSGKIVLLVDSAFAEGMSYRVCDAGGHVVLSGIICERETILPGYALGARFLMILDREEIIKTFKVIGK